MGPSGSFCFGESGAGGPWAAMRWVPWCNMTWLRPKEGGVPIEGNCVVFC